VQQLSALHIIRVLALRNPIALLNSMAIFAQCSSATLAFRTKAGLEAARQEGRIGGRRAKLSLKQQAEIRKMVSKGDKTAADAARLFKIHPATVSRLLARPATTVFRKREYAK
jgi:DNA invertase Pin-like site-specific DNA recombinase